MLDGLFVLLLLSFVMATASFIAGILPLTMSLSQSQLRLISSVGMGVLVGTSMIVIIPEGVEALYSADLAAHSPKEKKAQTPGLDVRWRVDMEDIPQAIAIPESPEKRGIISDTGIYQPDITARQLPTKSDQTHSGAQPITQFSKMKPPEASSEKTLMKPSSLHAYVGVSLILGFILMYLIDQLPQHAAAKSQSQQAPHHISLGNLSQGLHLNSLPSQSEGREDFMISRQAPTSRSSSITTGLVIHTAADGIALGASSSAANMRLGFVIFFAIMIHKAPAAFGLTSVLLKQGLSKREARSHLIIFSLAAPVAAVITWLLLHLLGGGILGGEINTKWWTGILLLFSGGTFLYVAMHTMQDDSSSRRQEPGNGYADSYDGPAHRKGPEMRDTVAAVAGMLLPLLTQLGNTH
ncbi:MAG: hypothetical protein M1829_005705 [Trizodia sp. TS-e1964]|nr:MAG: hypothetical protein M1829_005705 [Trizodia sp. TS-e1964]